LLQMMLMNGLSGLAHFALKLVEFSKKGSRLPKKWTRSQKNGRI